jgi:hypothetical protein
MPKVERSFLESILSPEFSDFPYHPSKTEIREFIKLLGETQMPIWINDWFTQMRRDISLSYSVSNPRTWNVDVGQMGGSFNLVYLSKFLALKLEQELHSLLKVEKIPK